MMETKEHYTWDELILYMRSVENCCVHGQGFHISNLYRYLDIIEETMEYTPPEERSKSLICRTIKTGLRRTFDAHRNGQIKPVGSQKEKGKFNNY
jgi:hypothetical protein